MQKETGLVSLTSPLAELFGAKSDLAKGTRSFHYRLNCGLLVLMGRRSVGPRAAHVSRIPAAGSYFTPPPLSSRLVPSSSQSSPDPVTA